MSREVILWHIIFLAGLFWSWFGPSDRLTWALEVAPAIIALLVLWGTWKRFKLTNLSYLLILVHSLILMIGAKYTYAEVPLFNWLQDAFDLSRNHYDKIGHLAQGFIPAIIAREILVRQNVLRVAGRWLFFIVCSICLAISAFYELIEWWVALLIGQDAEAFLGTQGYEWDTQSDMFLALIGAILAQFLLSKAHDRQIMGSDSGSKNQ